jgi:hypothetical protein
MPLVSLSTYNITFFLVDTHFIHSEFLDSKLNGSDLTARILVLFPAGDVSSPMLPSYLPYLPGRGSKMILAIKSDSFNLKSQEICYKQNT